MAVLENKSFITVRSLGLSCSLGVSKFLPM